MDSDGGAAPFNDIVLLALPLSNDALFELRCWGHIKLHMEVK